MATSAPAQLLQNREIRSLVIQARRLTDESSLGAYRSAFRGQGIEFEEVREYVPGDDIRSIDWKVTARSGRPFVKSFREERELSVMLVCDLSLSTGTGTKGILRRDVVNQVASILTLVAMQNRDRVGLLTFAKDIQRYFKPERKRSLHLKILGELLEEERVTTTPGTDFLGAVQFLRNVLRRRSTLFFLSDFSPNPFRQSPEFRQELRALCRRHDTTMCMVNDPGLENLPSEGLWPIISPETGEEFLIDLSSKEFRSTIAKSVRKERESLETSFREIGADVLSLDTTGNAVLELRSFFEKRARARGGR